MVYCPFAGVAHYYPEAKTVVTIINDIPDIPLFVGAAEQSCKELGWTYLGYEKVPGDTKDFSPVIQRVMAKKPDIVDLSNLGGSMGAACPVAIKQLREQGFDGPIAIPASPPEDAMQEIIPPKSFNKIVSKYAFADGSIVTPEYSDILERTAAKFDIVPTNVVPLEYNALKGFFQFLNTQDTMDTTVWMQGFEQYRWENPWGTESFWCGKPLHGINRSILAESWVTYYVDGKPICEWEPYLPLEWFVEE